MAPDLHFDIHRQPTDETCGPTCLHAVYRYHGDDITLDRVISEVTTQSSGGTIAAFLGQHALARGYRATLYSYNLRLLDPSWFLDPATDLAEQLERQAAVKSSAELSHTTSAYHGYLVGGGKVRFEELRPELIRRYLQRGLPLMSGLSATYLYGAMRERWDGAAAHYDAILGEPTGHFVVLHGYDASTDSVMVADPYHDNPLAEASNYRVGLMRLVGAILLGVLTNDGNLLVLEPPTDP